MRKNVIKNIICCKKRFLLVFCVLLLPAALGLIGTADNRQKTIEQDPALYKTIDAEGIFHIYDLEDFAAFLKYVKTGHQKLDAVLEADLEMPRSPYWVQNYSGHFDGQGHRITGVTHELFLLLEKDGIVENLIAEVNIEPYEDTDTGGLIYYSCGTIRNCEVYGTVTGYHYVGGIAAINLGLIQNCKNYASVTSLEDGQTIEYSHWTDGYGAGGIAGLCATTRNETEIPEICAIIDCENYGSVTGKSYAGGIVAYLDDRTDELAPASSVQELIQNKDFTTPSDQFQESDASTPSFSQAQNSSKNQEESIPVPQGHYSLMRCCNYGTVTVQNRQDPRTLWYTQAAGICAELHWGSLYGCANLGKVCFDESAPKYSESGYIYTNCPMAITYNLGFAPTQEHHVINCVNLKGTVAETMRHENIMELSPDEMAAWKEGNYQEDYISNNWEFDLPKAIEVCGLQSLNISPNPLLSEASSKQPKASLAQKEISFSQKKNYYLCDAFAICLPDYFEIEEVGLSTEDSSKPYALHITIQKEAYKKALSEQENATTNGDEVHHTPSRLTTGLTDEECWIVRKDADIWTALKEAKESNTRDEWRVRYFLEELFETVSPYHYMDICSLNLPFHNSFQAKSFSGRRIFAEASIPDMSLYSYLQEGDHLLGNMLVMPLQGLQEPLGEQLKAQWIMVFTMKGTNIHPSRAFIDLVESCFYPLDGTEGIHTVKAGDSLWQLADDYTLRPENWKLIADLNGIDDPAYILPGTVLIVPSLEAWEKDQAVLSSSLIMRN